MIEEGHFTFSEKVVGKRLVTLLNINFYHNKEKRYLFYIVARKDNVFLFKNNATITMFGGLNNLILIRCFLLNSIFGMAFGWMYQKLGLQYAMIAHALGHVILVYFLL
ncbi:abortive phage infection protein [Bacillus sp. AFS018417]|uniref:abortive phage infection protein n=1 Tax=Bacillus sp. AFS018417 TaxID=2033491 RepID=UPI0020D22A29|nr:abortive phage infection protein [Bacillus sp. AFS018417]